MVHPNTERLTAYWRGKATPGEAARRADVDPMDFHPLLPQTFVVGRSSQGTFPFRLVGGLVADLHRTDLRGRCLLELWRPADRWPLKSALDIARRRAEPVVLTADLVADGVPSVGLEVLLAPMTGPGGEVDRFLGLYQPTAPVARLMGRPVRMLALTAVVSADGGEAAPALRLAAVDGRRIA